ncbi:MAG TPA: peroxiredoxin [Gammaproteobacteria bacterium]|nr:peroxiredoxin [Gammaproteobacteria bacterium]
MPKSSSLIDQPVADLQFVSTQNTLNSFSQLRGKNIVIYFYPKDNTPGCTRESQDFRDLHEQFTALDTIVLGVSRDSLKSHENFIRKHKLPFVLISDSDEALCHYFNVIKQKKLFGVISMGIQRSTFLIDRQGIIRKEWRNVRVPNHATEVQAAVAALKS